MEEAKTKKPVKEEFSYQTVRRFSKILHFIEETCEKIRGFI